MSASHLYRVEARGWSFLIRAEGEHDAREFVVEYVGPTYGVSFELDEVTAVYLQPEGDTALLQVLEAGDR